MAEHIVSIVRYRLHMRKVANDRLLASKAPLPLSPSRLFRQPFRRSIAIHRHSHRHLIIKSFSTVEEHAEEAIARRTLNAVHGLDFDFQFEFRQSTQFDVSVGKISKIERRLDRFGRLALDSDTTCSLLATIIVT